MHGAKGRASLDKHLMEERVSLRGICGESFRQKEQEAHGAELACAWNDRATADGVVGGRLEATVRMLACALRETGKLWGGDMVGRWSFILAK